MTNSRAKGCRGEREWRDMLRSMGYDGARRGQQYSGANGDPDVVGGIPNTHCEVKRVESLSLYKAMEQAVEDARDGEVPYVAHKRNRKDWLVIVRACDLEQFAKEIER